MTKLYNVNKYYVLFKNIVTVVEGRGECLALLRLLLCTISFIDK